MRSLNDPPCPEWLRTEYVTKERSCKQIARELNTHGNTVKRWLVLANIPLRDNKKACVAGSRRRFGIESIPSLEVMQDLYVNKQIPYARIAEKYNVSQATARKWLKDYGIQLRPKVHRTRKRHHRFSGHGNITGYVWACIRQSAKVRGLAFDITIEEAWQLFQQQGGRCALSNVEIVLPLTHKEKLSGLGTASLDRRDSLLPYRIDNVQWVHKAVNIMKNKFSQDVFVDFCRRIAQHKGGL